VVDDVVSERFVLLGIIISAAAGVPGLLVGRHLMSGQWMSTVLAVAASSFGLAGIGAFWLFGDSQPIVRDWALLPGAPFSVVIDGLSALFLLPVFLVSLLGNIYGLEYWRQAEHAETGQKLRLFYGTLTAGLALLVVAGNSVVFLFGWEIMALSAYFLVTTEAQDSEVRDAGWLYLVATHVATLLLVGLFAVLRAASGSFALAPLDADRLSPGMATAIFVLALAGFGLKAGVMPLHVWLPSAHAAAPSHVSAIMSGVLIKMGIYGLARVLSLVPNPPITWGGVLLGLGVVSGVLGVAFAISQHDIKRLLAYHSIENIGIIVMGLGLALIGRSLGRADWVLLGLAGGLLHVLNHALFKALLFLSAGSVIHTTHTREIDHLGGLAKEMPATSLCFLIGAVAICGLPPLNGFVSELLIYLGLFGTLVNREGSSYPAAAFATPALALIGGLALACFVKVYGAVFLGTARSDHARHAQESPLAMTGPMGILAGCCFLIGLFPPLIAPMLAGAVAAWDPALDDAGVRLAALAPLNWIMITGLLLTAALFIGGVAFGRCLGHSVVEKGATWGCGYLAPTPRMQYTSSSFAQILVGLFGWVLRPRASRPKDLALFPPTTAFRSEVSDAILDEAMLPAVRFVGWLFSWFRVLQQGNIQTYLLYIFITLMVLLIWH
jgi:hydrogenase-4 component B